MAKHGTLHKVWETKELEKFSRSNEAKQLLEKLAQTVGPLMERKKWKVPILKEFFPANDGLLGLNVNRGQSILVRLRPHYNKDEFFPWEHILGTMIHELTHIQIGPHNADFYKLMDELADEVDADVAGGRTGSSSSGFVGPSHKLSDGTLVKKLSKEEAAKKAAESALKRLQHKTLIAGSGSKLGGSGPMPGRVLTKEELRQKAAYAAQRRLRDDATCPTRESTLVAKPVTNRQPTPGAASTESDEFPDTWACNLCETMNLLSTDECSFCWSLKTGPSSGSRSHRDSSSDETSAHFPLEAQVSSNCAVIDLVGDSPTGSTRGGGGGATGGATVIDLACDERDAVWDERLCGLCDSSTSKLGVSTAQLTDGGSYSSSGNESGSGSTYGVGSSGSSSSIGHLEAFRQEVTEAAAPRDSSCSVGWSCSSCTFVNDSSLSSCEICASLRSRLSLSSSCSSAPSSSQNMALAVAGGVGMGIDVDVDSNSYRSFGM